MTARTGLTAVAVLRPADALMDFEFGLTELTTIELNTEGDITLTLQAASNPSPDSVPLQAEPPSRGART